MDGNHKLKPGKANKMPEVPPVAMTPVDSASHHSFLRHGQAVGGRNPAGNGQHGLGLGQTGQAGQGHSSHGNQGFLHEGTPLNWLQNII
jgi:hypothetical protein